MMSIDPGTKVIGWALWQDSKLFRCGLARGKDWIRTVSNVPKEELELVVIEDQQIYRSSSIDAHSLLKLARVVGGTVFHLQAGDVKLVKPREWKGQVPKKICNSRTLQKLQMSEKVAVELAQCPEGLKHNMIDAIGIGLFYLRR